MERAQSRMLLAMAAILMIVVGVLYGVGPGDEVPDAEATELVWPALTLDDIARVRVERRAHDPLVIERVGERWRVLEPVDDTADADAVLELLDDLREIERGIPVTDGADRPEEFGLGEPPEARVEVTRTDGSTQQVEVGIPVPIGYRTYMRAESGKIVAVNGDANETLQRRGEAFRDHRLFRFDPAAVRAVRIESAHGVLEVHGERLRWWLEGHARAEPDRVDDLVMGLLDLRFDVVLGLDEAVAEPRYVVTVTVADGSEHTARFGRDSPMGTLAKAGDRVGAVFPESLALLGQGPVDLADPRAIPLDLERDSVVRVSRGEQQAEATRNGSAWQIAGRDDGAAWDVVSALSEVAAVWKPEPPAPPSHTWATIVVQRPDERWEVQVGERIEGGSFRVAVDAAGGRPYRVASEPLERAVGTFLDQP
jgi:hypothetical protein